MALYESTFIIRQDLSAPDVNKITETLTNIIAENGGKVLKTEQWGLRNLAYIIKKNRKGHYVFMVIDAPNKAMVELERRVKLSDDVIRHLVIRIESFDGKDSIMLTASNEDKIEDVI